MRVRSVRLKHFKQFEDRTLDFTDPITGAPRDLVVLIGPNGAGKSTVLQSIAATLGTATGRLRTPRDLQSWPGFNLDLAGRAWKAAPEIDIDVDFPPDELDAVVELHARLNHDRYHVEPARDPSVRLTLADQRVWASDESRYFQLRGRHYAQMLKSQHPDGFGVFERVGSVFWYTEQRTANSLTLKFETNDESPQVETTLTQLRQALANAESHHLRRGGKPLPPGQRDIYGELDRLYREIFPGRCLAGSESRGEPGDLFEAPYFFLQQGERRYEIAEMSGAERAVFPLLFDVAHWSIHRSVVLIDELELHLHPPIQQALLRALRRLGTQNQFIISTHAEAVASLVPPSAIVRL